MYENRLCVFVLCIYYSMYTLYMYILWCKASEKCDLITQMQAVVYSFYDNGDSIWVCTHAPSLPPFAPIIISQKPHEDPYQDFTFLWRLLFGPRPPPNACQKIYNAQMFRLYTNNMRGMMRGSAQNGRIGNECECVLSFIFWWLRGSGVKLALCIYWDVGFTTNRTKISIFY